MLVLRMDQEITRPVITSLEPNPFGPTPESPEPNEDTIIEDEDEISQLRARQDQSKDLEAPVPQFTGCPPDGKYLAAPDIKLSVVCLELAGSSI
ncbi:hypothetical protein RRG08_022210 [Elysia crispata]|uniref:Uncharacterized protein n=1 Tax=Elysia crispata TaxID=231223 RepID=A0AAE0YLR9_9GAST|nr:hypothetical protein RRG08_022210 [Elysia crispata]